MYENSYNIICVFSDRLLQSNHSELVNIWCRSFGLRSRGKNALSWVNPASRKKSQSTCTNFGLSDYRWCSATSTQYTSTLCTKFLSILKGSFPLTLRCVLAFVAMATRLRRALIEEKIPSFKIPTNLIHSVLAMTYGKNQLIHGKKNSD